MKPPPLRWLAVTAAAAAAVLCWYLLTREPDATPRTAGKGMAPAALVTGKGAAPSLKEPMPKFGTPEFKSALKERGKKWLESRGRDAVGLIAMWELTGDQRFLQEAHERFPDEPRVWVAMLQDGLTPSAIERMIAAEPDNPEWLYQKIELVTTTPGSKYQGDPIISLLRQAAATKGRRDNHLLESMQRVRETSLALGVGPGDAVRLALVLLDNVSPTVSYAVMQVLGEEHQAAKLSGSEDRVREIMELGIATADKFSSARLLTLSEAGRMFRLKKSLLADLSDDTMIGTSGRTVASFRAELVAWSRVTSLVPHDPFSPHIPDTATDELAGTYFNLFTASGEAEALLWLRQQTVNEN